MALALKRSWRLAHPQSWRRPLSSCAKTAAVAVCAVSIAACGHNSSRQLTPLGLREVDHTTLVLTVECAVAGSARAEVIEANDLVTISEIVGDALRGEDCAEEVTINLAEPLGDRTVVVNDESWGRYDDDCAYGPIRPSAQCG